MEPRHQETGTWRALVDAWLVLRYTRHWIHYGSISFVVICAVIAAVRGVAGQ